MLTSEPAEFLRQAGAPAAKNRSTMDAAMLVVAAEFQVVDETAADNRYVQVRNRADPVLALQQQQAVAQTLRDLGLPVLTFGAIEGAGDSIFPNNAFAPCNDRLIVGAMRHPVRQRETERADIARFFQALGHQVVDLRAPGVVAELTGSLIIDHARRIGFCGLSERANAAGAQAMHEAFGLSATLQFELAPDEYHTNVVLSVLAGRAAVVCSEAVQGAALMEALDALYPDAVLALTSDEKNAFAGNCLAVTPSDVVISQRAKQQMRPSSIAFFERNGFTLHALDVSELERAGGSVRCMIAEIFFKRKRNS